MGAQGGAEVSWNLELVTWGGANWGAEGGTGFCRSIQDARTPWGGNCSLHEGSLM